MARRRSMDSVQAATAPDRVRAKKPLVVRAAPATVTRALVQPGYVPEKFLGKGRRRGRSTGETPSS